MPVIGRQPRTRGFILLEALVGGVVLATSIVLIFHELASIENRLSEARHRARAYSALSDGMAMFRGKPAEASAPSTSSVMVADHDPFGSLLTGSCTSKAPSNVCRTIAMGTPISTSNSSCPGCVPFTVTVRYRNANRQWRVLEAEGFIAP